MYEAVQKSYFGGSFGSSVDKKECERDYVGIIKYYVFVCVCHVS